MKTLKILVSIVLVCGALSTIAQPSAAAGKESTVHETFMRFSAYSEPVMKKLQPETVQDELVLFSSLLMQDALSDQKMAPADVAEFSGRLKQVLCAGVEPNSAYCKVAITSLEAIGKLYRGEDRDSHNTEQAIAVLMSAVVSWLDANPGPQPLRK